MLENKPYKFLALPDNFETRPVIWQDGSRSAEKLSGEIRVSLTNLTPLIVGWERQTVEAGEGAWESPDGAGDQPQLQQFVERLVGRVPRKKPVLIPLRAPWGAGPVLLPGDSLKGLLRHELGALLGAPMERVAERSYSYRPNAMYPNERNPRLEPRLARVPRQGVEVVELPGLAGVRVPVRLEVLPGNLRYDRRGNSSAPRYRFSRGAHAAGEPYRGGIFAGATLTPGAAVHQRIDVTPCKGTVEQVPEDVRSGYLNTIRHLTDPAHGHFTRRHPGVTDDGAGYRQRAAAAASTAFQEGDLAWVEWDNHNHRIVSFGWHYYYRWAYQDTVRRRNWTDERLGLFPLESERKEDPVELSPVRRLFGYSSDNEGSAGIGSADASQLMGRISVNTAIEAVGPDETDDDRFEPPTFLKELGQPRPSAVEFYLKQPWANRERPADRQRPSDRASLVTYGDAKGYDDPGILAGRKFYLDRGAPGRAVWEDASDENRNNERSTLVLNASKPNRTFRFTLRFWDVEPGELAAIMLALCPNQFGPALSGKHPELGYCSKLGYARPYGWGSLRAEAAYLTFVHIDDTGNPILQEEDAAKWFEQNRGTIPTSTKMADDWLRLHRVNHRAAADYPRGHDGEIYSYHTDLRAQHSRLRRYPRERR